MKPLIYGYMRIEGDEPDVDLRHTERALYRVAQRKGYRFVTTFHEFDSGGRCYLAWNDLVEQLKRVSAHHLIVPSFDHVAAHAILREVLIEHLWCDAHAQVISVADVHARPGGPCVAVVVPAARGCRVQQREFRRRPGS